MYKNVGSLWICDAQCSVDKSAIELENNCDILACNFPSHIEQKDKENICNYHVLLYIQLLYLVYVYPLIGRCSSWTIRLLPFWLWPFEILFLCLVQIRENTAIMICSNSEVGRGFVRFSSASSLNCPFFYLPWAVRPLPTSVANQAPDLAFLAKPFKEHILLDAVMAVCGQNANRTKCQPDKMPT